MQIGSLFLYPLFLNAQRSLVNISTTPLGSVTQKDLTKTFFGALSLQTRPVSQVRLASSAKVFVKAAYFILTALNLRTVASLF